MSTKSVLFANLLTYKNPTNRHICSFLKTKALNIEIHPISGRMYDKYTIYEFEEFRVDFSEGITLNNNKARHITLFELNHKKISKKGLISFLSRYF